MPPAILRTAVVVVVLTGMSLDATAGLAAMEWLVTPNPLLAAPKATIAAVHNREPVGTRSGVAIRPRQDLPAPRQAWASVESAWTHDTQVGGTLFLDLASLDATRGNAETGTSGPGFDVKRFYLSVDHKFNETWSANLTTDFNYTNNNGRAVWFVKKAYLQGAFSQLAILRAGSANMPWIPFVERWYGYRFVEKTLIDRAHFGNSADWGVHLLGGNGAVDYQVSAVNGAGFKDPSRTGHVDVAVRVGVQPLRGLMLAVGGYRGKLGAHGAAHPALRGATRYDAMVAWARNGLRMGAEWFEADNWKNVARPAGDRANGWSTWGSYDFSCFSIFGRYDRVRPSTQLDPSLKDTYWHTGVAFPVGRGMRLAMAYKDERLHNGRTGDVHTREVGVWAELAW